MSEFEQLYREVIRFAEEQHGARRERSGEHGFAQAGLTARTLQAEQHRRHDARCRLPAAIADVHDAQRQIEVRVVPSQDVGESRREQADEQHVRQRRLDFGARGPRQAAGDESPQGNANQGQQHRIRQRQRTDLQRLVHAKSSMSGAPERSIGAIASGEAFMSSARGEAIGLFFRKICYTH